MPPREAVVYFSRGLVRSQLDRHEQAITDLDEARRLDPKHVPTLVSRGIAWLSPSRV